MEKFNSFQDNEVEDKKEVPEWVHKIRNYSVVSIAALSTFLASCGDHNTPKEKISSKNIETVGKIEGMEKVSLKEIKNTIEILGTEGYSLHFSERNRDFEDEQELKGHFDDIFRDEASFEQNDSTYILKEHLVKDLDWLEKPASEIDKDFWTGNVIKRTTGRKIIENYYIEIDKKTGVIIAFSSKSEKYDGVQKRHSGEFEFKEQTKIDSSNFITASDGKIYSSENYKPNEATSFVKSFDYKVSKLYNQDEKEVAYRWFIIMDKKGNILKQKK